MRWEVLQPLYEMIGRRSIESVWSAHFGKLLESDGILIWLPRNDMEGTRWGAIRIVGRRRVGRQENIVLEPQYRRDYARQRGQQSRQGSIPC